MSKRTQMIEKLVDDDIDSIFTMKEQYNDEYYLANMLLNGFRGYENYTNEELLEEMIERELEVV